MYKDIISDYLKKIDRLINKKSDQISKSRERLNKTYELKEVDHVPIIDYTSDELYLAEEIFLDFNKSIISQLCKIYLTLQHKTDYLPFIDIGMGAMGVTTIASLFGGKVIMKGECLWIKPIISNPEDILNIRKPKIKNTSTYRKVKECIDFVKRNIGKCFPIGITDPQGPLDVASQLLSSSVLAMACITHKKEVHYLLDLITDVFIEFNEMQYELIGEDCLASPGQLWPLRDNNKKIGIPISDDIGLILSPDLFLEFGVPYLTKISEKFGGLYYHSCGNYLHILKHILSITGIIGINGHSSPKEMDPVKATKIIKNQCVYYSGYSSPFVGWGKQFTKHEYLDIYYNYYLKNVIGNGKGVIITGISGYGGYKSLRKNLTDVQDSILDYDSPAIKDKNRFYEKVVSESNKVIEENIKLFIK